jgi:hypothetical protein
VKRKSENVLKDVLGRDSIVDPDAYLEDRSLLEGSGSVDLAVIVQADVGLHGVVEIGVGGLGVSSTVGADPSELAVRSTVMVTFVS